MADGKAVFLDSGVLRVTPQLAYRNVVLAAYRVFSAPEVKYSLALATVTVIYMLAYTEKPVPAVDEVDELIRRHPRWDRRLLTALKDVRDKIGE